MQNLCMLDNFVEKFIFLYKPSVYYIQEKIPTSVQDYLQKSPMFLKSEDEKFNDAKFNNEKVLWTIPLYSISFRTPAKLRFKISSRD